MHSIRRQMLSSCRLAKVATEIGIGGKQETVSLGADSGLAHVVIETRFLPAEARTKRKALLGSNQTKARERQSAILRLAACSAVSA